MVRAALLSFLLCASGVIAQVEPSQPAGDGVVDAAAGEQMPELPEDAVTEPATPIDPVEADLIGRINDEMDRRGETEDGADVGSFQRARVPGPASNLLQGIFALSFVLGLIFLVYYGIRKWGKKVPLLAGSSLGTILGRMHLERGTALHFVRTGGRVLIVGVNGNAVSLVADFDAKAFESVTDAPVKTPDSVVPFNPDSFLAQLQASSKTMESSRVGGDEMPVDDDEIAALRGDIQRLQRYLREESRESQD